jgi:hypothetical protein
MPKNIANYHRVHIPKIQKRYQNRLFQGLIGKIYQNWGFGCEIFPAESLEK